jgi:RNA polymerase sigma-70 factor (ECF subfamily)
MAFGIEKEVMERALTGDTQALGALVVELRPHVERQLQRYPVTDEDRRDLVQATLVQVIRRLGSFRGDSSFSTWLFRVTANEALMLMRSQRRHRARLVEGMSLDELAALPGARENATRPDVEVVQAERDAHVRTALAELPDGYRDVVMAHYHHGLGLEEIATQLELTESAVRSRLHRARGQLRELLAGFMAELEPSAAPA